MKNKHDGNSGSKKLNFSTIKLFKKQGFLATCIFIFFLAVATVISLYTIKDMQKSNYKRNTQSVNVVMANLSKNLDLTFDSKWENIHRASKHLKTHTPSSLTELSELLTDMRSEYANAYVNYFLLDDLGNAYYANGLITHFKYALSVKENEDIVLLIEPEFGLRTESLMVYIVPLDSPFTIDSIHFSHIVFSEPMTNFKKNFDTTGYGTNSLSFIITKDGKFIYENGLQTSISKSYNFLKFISNDKNVKFQFDENYDSFYQAFLNPTYNETFLITYNNQNYYMSFYALKMQDWYSIILVPEMNIENDNSSFSQRMMVDILILFLTVAFLFAIFVTIMWRRTINKQKMATEAERRSNLAKTDFLSSMSHDIRTPMNAILGMTQIALHNYENPALVKQNLNKINTSSLHLLTLINDILDISKIESGKMPLNIAEFSVNSSIETIVNIIKPLAKEKRIALNVKTNLLHDKLLGDELRINQVCLNLITNAIKYTQDNGKVELDFSQEEIKDNPDMLKNTIVVRDNGMGMSKEFQKIMYNTFSRGTDSRVNKISGSGLGLAICHQLVLQMNGSIDCKSNTGEGTIFTITLVLKKSNSKDSALAVHSPLVEQGAKVKLNTNLNGMRVLVAEDNDLNWEVLNTILQMQGVKADRADNGQIALNMLESCEQGFYKAVLMDIRMPIMDGREATKKIRINHKPWVRSIPVVAMTADAFAEDIQACLDSGMNAHLSKPIISQKLTDTLIRIWNNLPLQSEVNLKNHSNSTIREEI